MAGNQGGLFVQSGRNVVIPGRMRYWRIAAGYGRRYRDSCSSENPAEQKKDAALKRLSIAPMVFVAWTALASPVFARNVLDKKAEPCSGVLGNRHVRKGEMSQADLSAVMDYYMLDDSQPIRSKKSVKTSELKVEVLSKDPSPKVEVEQERSRHPQCDGDVVKVELKAFVAILVVSAVATAYWKWSRRAAEEASFGLDTELHDFTPIRDMPTEETEEEKEYIRMEAMRRIQRAKQQEEEFRSRKVGQDDDMEAHHSGSSSWQDDDEDDDIEEEVQNEQQQEERATISGNTSTVPTNPLLLGLALLSTMVDDVKRAIDNRPKYILPDGRVLGCSRDGRAGRSMCVQTSRIRVVKPHHPGKKLTSRDILLVPFAPLAKSVQGKQSLPLISDKYNPMNEFHHFVSNNTGTALQTPTERDPFHALVQTVKSFDGFKAPGNLKKYDPTSHLDQLIIARGGNDMISSFVRAILSYQGPQTSAFLSKYDPLQGMGDVMPEKGTSEYNILQGMLHATPHASHYDIWKALVEVKPPKIDGDVLKPANSLVEYVKRTSEHGTSKYD